MELLARALDLFLEKGFERTSIAEITASLGMAKRTIYVRYRNKIGLFKASLERAVQEWIVPVGRLRAAETEDLEETLLGVGEILVANALSPAGVRLMRVTNAESGRMPEIATLTSKLGTQPTVEYLADLIRRRIRPGGNQVPDPEEAANAFLDLVVGGPAYLIAWGITLDEEAINKHTRYRVRLFLRGLLHLTPEIVGENGAIRARGGRKPIHPANSASVAIQDHQELNAVEQENRRLKLLLAESMLNLAALKESKGDH